MKKEIGLAFMAVFLLSLTAITAAYAIDNNEKVITIAKEEADITGDNRNEVVTLKGVPYQDDESYLKSIFIKIIASNGKTYTIPLDAGTKADLKLTDLNHDGIKDIFASVLTAGTSGDTLNYLHSLKDFVDVDLKVPEQLEMDSKFLNGYKAKITIKDTGKSYLFDMMDRKDYYKKLGLYYRGRLNEPTELTVNSYSSLTPITLNNSLPGLKGTQRITGIANGDTIALVESTWVYKKGQWKLVDTDVKKGNAS